MPDNDLTRLPIEDSKVSLLSAGQSFGQYQVTRLLGRGGMGEAYEVAHPVLEKRFVLKLLSPEIMSRPDAAERFKREAKVMARLEHANIVKVDDFGETDGLTWLRMELMEGWQYEGKNHQSLQSLIKECAPLPESLVSQFIRQILEGLAAAHDSGAIHRDLKPANLLISAKGSVKITDFGLVSLAGADWLQSQVQLTVARSMAQPADPDATRLDPSTSSGQVGSGTGTSTQALLGTYAFMSPEQKKGLVADARSDLYAVALIAFQMLTGDETLGLEMPSDLIDGLDSSWDDWIKRGIATRLERRFQNTSQMLNQLTGYSAAVDSHAAPPPLEPVGAKESLKDPPKPPSTVGSQGAFEPEKDFELKFGESTLKMKWIAPGKFMMGSPEEVREGGFLGLDIGGQITQEGENGRQYDEAHHEVTLSQGFWLGTTPITQAHWQSFMGSNSSRFKGSDLPVESVSWEEAISFCRELTKTEHAKSTLREEWSYTLPTEAQWEYACRAGSTGAYADELDVMAWYCRNSGSKMQHVGQKKSNIWGLYDMHGNVGEWCLDWYGNYPSGRVVDPKGASSGSFRVFRGGSWHDDAEYCRSAYRCKSTPSARWHRLGFRLALSS